ncbi:MAG: hypothetical protein WCB68_01135 [Pyrinomonadaceae bacterium]
MRRKRIIVFAAIISLLSLCAPAGTSQNRRARQLQAGEWGGTHISLQVNGSDTTIEYDCAHGTIDQPLTLDRRGRFSAKGTHAREHAGPIRRGEQSNARPARYTGWINGNRMTLKVTLTDTNEMLGPYTLVRGREPRIVKCL